MDTYHIPVMLEEAVSSLNVQKDCWYVDCNVGGGGHSSRILELGGNVLGIDLDPDAILHVAENYQLKTHDQNGALVAVSDTLILCQSNFSKISEITKRFNIIPVGVLFDLGMSSYQLEYSKRGFSFNQNSALDMRMDPKSAVLASDLIHGLSQKELAELFLKYGEEFQAKKIAQKIVDTRKIKRIETTFELAALVESAFPGTLLHKIHPATRVFQALRIAVNDELNSLKIALRDSFLILPNKGRIVVISFHSLEDRIIKNFFKKMEQEGLAHIHLAKPVISTQEEIKRNPRSRSAKLRLIEKV